MEGEGRLVGGQQAGEGGQVGEGGKVEQKEPLVIRDKSLTFEEASKCLNTLAKDETACRYAYIMLSAMNMKLTEISTILKFKHVLFVDVSDNYLTTEALEVLGGMPFLVLIKAERNRVVSAHLPIMHYLQVLDLNHNQIKETSDIEQPLLDSLELNRNDIYTVDFDSAKLETLKQLELRANLLFEIAGNYPVSLEKLYLPANKIASINGDDLGKLGNLQTLHLRDNLLTNLDGFSEQLRSLKYLNLRNNKIARLKEIVKLQCLPQLETLIVTGNPFAGEQMIGPAPEAGEGATDVDPIRIPILVLLPNLKRINKLPVTLEDRYKAEDYKDVVFGGMLDAETVQEEETDMGATTTEYTTDDSDDLLTSVDDTPRLGPEFGATLGAIPVDVHDGHEAPHGAPHGAPPHGGGVREHEGREDEDYKMD